MTTETSPLLSPSVSDASAVSGTSNAFTDAAKWYQRPRVLNAPNNFNALLEDTLDTLKSAADTAPCVFANSLSAEDMVIIHLIATHHLDIENFALDTFKLPTATHTLWRSAEAHYNISIQVVHASEPSISALTSAQADSAIYENKSARERCCHARKTEPLRAALKGKAAWVTGLRRAQSAGRANVAISEFDAAFGLQKFNPLVDWSDEALWYFIDHAKIPVSTLYDKGYASIGCEPCTRPIRISEHPRAGRWWWEAAAAANGASTECGIHVQPLSK